MFDVRRWFLLGLVYVAATGSVVAEQTAINIDPIALRDQAAGKVQSEAQLRKDIQAHTDKLLQSYYSVEPTGQVELVSNEGKEGLKVGFVLSVDYDASENYKNQLLSASNSSHPLCFTVNVVFDKTEIHFPEERCTWFIDTYRPLNNKTLPPLSKIHRVTLQSQAGELRTLFIATPIWAEFGYPFAGKRIGPSRITMNVNTTRVLVNTELKREGWQRIKLISDRTYIQPEQEQSINFDLMFEELDSDTFEQISGVTIEPVLSEEIFAKQSSK